jgi:hypothetical protein
MALVVGWRMGKHFREIRLGHVDDMAEALTGDQRAGRRIVAGRVAAPQLLGEGIGQPSGRNGPEGLTVV